VCSPPYPSCTGDASLSYHRLRPSLENRQDGGQPGQFCSVPWRQQPLLYPASAFPVVPSRWRSPAERQSRLSPNGAKGAVSVWETGNRSNRQEITWRSGVTSLLFSRLSIFLRKGTSFLLQGTTSASYWICQPLGHQMLIQGHSQQL